MIWTKKIRASFFKLFLMAACVILTSQAYAQAAAPDPALLKPDPAKEKMFRPYLAVKHGGPVMLDEWKKSNTYQYYLELWYYCESFYVKRNHLNTGITLDESIIDISRLESSRKAHEEAIVVMPGFKDALVLLPGDKLLYKPQ